MAPQPPAPYPVATAPATDPALATLGAGVIAPTGSGTLGGGKADPYNLSGLAGAQINGAALFGPGSLSDAQGYMTAEQAMYNFIHADGQVRAGIQLAMWKAGFYSASTQVADLNLGSKYVKSDDTSAFARFLLSAVDAGGQGTTQVTDSKGAQSTELSGSYATPDLRTYLNSVAQIGDAYGPAGARGYLSGQAQANKPDLRAITTTDPAGVRASLRAAYQAGVGRNPTNAEFAAFTAAFTGAQRASQMTPYEVSDAQNAFFAGQYSTDPITGLPAQPGPRVVPPNGGRGKADEMVNDLADANAAQGAAPGSLRDVFGGPTADNKGFPGGHPGGPVPNQSVSSADSPASTADAFLHSIMGSELGGNPTAQNKHASASGLFGYTDGTWAHFGGYAHAKDAPPDVQWEKARHDVLAKLNAYGGDWRKVAMSWYLPAAVNNSALANSIPAPQAGNRLTPNQYADLIIGRMSRATNVAFSASTATYPGGQQPVYYNVSSPDLGARAVENAMSAHPAEYGAHATAQVMDSFLSLIQGNL